MPEVQPVEYNEFTRAVPETGIRKAVTRVPGCRFSSSRLDSSLYRKRCECGELHLDTVPIGLAAGQALCPTDTQLLPVETLIAG